MSLTAADLADLAWPPRCSDAFCGQCQTQIAICAELSYIVYDAERKRFIRLCEECYRGTSPAAPHAA